MPIIIKPVTTKREMKQFICFNYELYKDSAYAVPDLYNDVRDTLDPKKNAAFEFCEAQPFIALRDGKVVGRIVAVINHKANKAWNKKSVRFGWVDFIDDKEVVDALFLAVEEWGRERGMDEIHGPLGFTDFDPEGMLVEGFDRISTMALIYNHPYYPEHMKQLGYHKETGWGEFRITLPDSIPDRHKQLSKLVIERNNLKVRKLTLKQIRKERYGQKLFQLINQTYSILYGFSMLSEKQIDQFVDTYLSLIDPRMLTFIEDENGELIAAGISMPSIANALQKCRGELFPFGWWHLVKTMFIKRSDTVELLLIGVRPDYKNKGIPTILICDLLETYNRLGFKYAETNAMLETNTAVRSLWAPFEHEQHKRRWIFAKEIE